MLSDSHIQVPRCVGDMQQLREAMGCLSLKMQQKSTPNSDAAAGVLTPDTPHSDARAFSHRLLFWLVPRYWEARRQEKALLKLFTMGEAGQLKGEMADLSHA